MEEKNNEEIVSVQQNSAIGATIKSFILKVIKYFVVINAVLYLLSRIRHESFTFHVLLNVIIPIVSPMLIKK